MVALDWSKRTDGQKVSFIISLIVVLAAIACIVSNIVTASQATKKKWFSGRAKDGAMFYVNRIVTIVFCLLVIVFEFHAVERIRKNFRAFRYFWVRGFFQAYVGFLTITGSYGPTDPDANVAVASIGWVLIIVGLLHFVLSCLCFKEYSAAKRAETEAAEMAAAAPGGAPAPPPIASDVGMPGSMYKI
jgi:hypothetical protein